MQLADLAPHLGAQTRVEIRKRLVEQEDRRLHRESARERHALLLAARKLVRISDRAALSRWTRSSARSIARVAASAVSPRLRDADPQRVADVLRDRHMRPDGVAIEKPCRSPRSSGGMLTPAP